MGSFGCLRALAPGPGLPSCPCVPSVLAGPQAFWASSTRHVDSVLTWRQDAESSLLPSSSPVVMIPPSQNLKPSWCGLMLLSEL
ncbi:hypothetical protein ACRRTK_007932 [Alexandromys fortis]